MRRRTEQSDAAATPGPSGPRFPGYAVVAQRRHWDEGTRSVVSARLDAVPEMEFFDPEQQSTGRALVDRLLAQDGDPRVPVLEVIDRRLARREGDGYRNQAMPEDGEAWARSLDQLDAEARSRFGESFCRLTVPAQMTLIEEVRRCEDTWHGFPAGPLFGLWVRYACDAFYSHPWAWNEIGFGGPAYPRGYKNLGLGRREPWERPERDAQDPVPWADRVEKVRADHSRAFEGADVAANGSNHPDRPLVNGGRPVRAPDPRTSASTPVDRRPANGLR